MNGEEMAAKRTRRPEEKIFIAGNEKINKQKNKSMSREQIDEATEKFLKKGGKIKVIETLERPSLNQVSSNYLSAEDNEEDFQRTISYIQKRIGPFG